MDIGADADYEVKLASEDITAFNEEILPEVLQGQITRIEELNGKVTKAVGSAKKAESISKAAAKNSINFLGFGTTKAIEELQKAGVLLAEAVQSGAEAQRVSFDFQKKLADITKYLFKLGTSSIAAHRIVVREIELRLKNASEEELSELARQELILVVQQLKDQEDILKKQEKITEDIKKHDKGLERLERAGDELLKKDEELDLKINSAKSELQQDTKNLQSEFDEKINQIRQVEVALEQSLNRKADAGAVSILQANIEEIRRQTLLNTQASNMRNSKLQQYLYVSWGISIAALIFAAWTTLTHV